MMVFVLAAFLVVLGRSDPCLSRLYFADNSMYYPVEALALEKQVFVADTRFSGTNFTFTTGICSPVPCGSANGRSLLAAGCQAWTGGGGRRLEHSLGDVSSAIFEVNANGFTVLYSGGESCTTTQRSMRIAAVCSPDDLTPRLVYERESSPCLFELTLYAARGPCALRANGPVSPTPTQVPHGCSSSFTSADGTYVYQPMRLARPTPYNATSDFTETPYRFDINICTPVPCGVDTNTVGGCQRWSTNTTTHHARSLGSISSVRIEPDPQGPRSGFKVVYTGGDICSSGVRRSTVVTVLCDPEASVMEGVLTFWGESSHCLLEFGLSAREACPDILTPLPAPSPGRCPAALPLASGAELYRLDALADHLVSGSTVADGIKYNFSLALCGSLSCPTAERPDGSGPLLQANSEYQQDRAAVCMTWADTKRSEEGGARVLGRESGVMASLLVPETAGFTVTYHNGDGCTDGRPASVTVEARCEEMTMKPFLEVVSVGGGCSPVLRLHSAALCPQRLLPDPQPVPCLSRLSTRDGGAYYPLSRLTAPLSDTYRVVADNGFEFELNICGVVPCEGTEADAGVGVAACERWVDQDGVRQTRVMGFAENTTLTPSVNNQGFTVVSTGGDKCGDSGLQRVTLVSVRCSPTDVKPVLVYDGTTSQCVYMFTLYAADGACPNVPTFHAAVESLLEPTRSRLVTLCVVAGAIVVVFALVALTAALYRRKSDDYEVLIFSAPPKSELASSVSCDTEDVALTSLRRTGKRLRGSSPSTPGTLTTSSPPPSPLPPAPAPASHPLAAPATLPATTPPCIAPPPAAATRAAPWRFADATGHHPVAAPPPPPPPQPSSSASTTPSTSPRTPPATPGAPPAATARAVEALVVTDDTLVVDDDGGGHVPGTAVRLPVLAMPPHPRTRRAAAPR